MKYRGIQDRTISTYFALIVIAIACGISTLLIVHAINSIEFVYPAAQILSGN